MNVTLQVGSIVLSKQGRDKGMYFVVVALDDSYAYLSDGGMRKLSSPKKKNLRHLSNTGTVLQVIAEKLLSSKKVFDSEVKSALRQYNQQNKENQ